ncbi:serine hydrolase domain-containing protein [Tenacibaculum soleae]|uniref:serine hydrolase domain-containing protein n=1 Tax=Tenacibaculum soleae TaxID=447689 RepID=UPI0022FFE656|nr:serine hydrolase domain-containing protein [Tenacibaculum soleae]
MKIKFLLVLSLLAFVNCKNSEKKEVSKSVDKIQIAIDKNVDSLLLDSKINAVSIGVYKDGKKYIAHYGELDKGKNNIPTNETIYEIASVSKTFTGVLVANAVIEGKLALDDDIRKYLKEDFKNFEYNGEPIRVKHLLTHTSRMSKFLPESINTLFNDFNEDLPFKVYEVQKDYGKKEFFRDLHTIELDTIPGTKYAYSNVDTELMAEILENVYEKSFNDILKEYFQNNANMQNTYIDLPKEKEQYLANGYGMTGKLVPHEVVIYGADGGVKTTMPDLVNYMQLHLDPSNKVAAESHRNLLENDSREIGYYFPIRNNEEYGTYYSMHGGGFGSQNWFFLLPEYNLGISVITNQSDLDTADKLMKVVKGLIEELKEW